MIHLETIELVPVVELEPWTFATQERQNLERNGAEDWARYWLDSLADSGIIGLSPIRPNSWHVATQQLTNSTTLAQIMTALVERWGGPEAIADPDETPVLSGGLVLHHDVEVLIEPTCCSDLGNLAEWKTAESYRQSDWHIVWIGHPWVSCRFEDDNLVLSNTHESDSPTERWSVKPEELLRAVAVAEIELEDFAGRIRAVLGSMGIPDAEATARKLVGLKD